VITIGRKWEFLLKRVSNSLLPLAVIRKKRYTALIEKKMEFLVVKADIFLFQEKVLKEEEVC
jgi:hypothetical protein